MLIYRKMSLVRLAWKLIVLGVLVGGGYLLWDYPYGVFVGAVGYVLWSRLGARVGDGAMRRGLRLLAQERPSEALAFFQKKQQFYEQNPFWDRRRTLVLLSVSGFDLREICLVNIAYCYVLLGDGLRAVETYELIHRDYPGNQIAASALEFAKLIEKTARDANP